MSLSAADWPYPAWIAHRGAGKLAPENTLAAFRFGAGYGYRMFECDVKLSQDGVPFLMHDASLERTTNGTGQGGDSSWAALSQLDAGSWHSRRYAGEPLPSLANIAPFVRKVVHEDGTGMLPLVDFVVLSNEIRKEIETHWGGCFFIQYPSSVAGGKS